MNHATAAPSRLTQVGIVVIGRNEGERLIRCLESIVGQVQAIVYVDSGSTDGSCEAAQSRGVQVINLDMSRPFSAARARNEGFAWIQDYAPDIRYVQFVDGDCEVLPGWLDAAAEALERDASIVAVCGGLRERYPNKTVFNRICSVEWNWATPGEVAAFGGNVMLRAKALAAVGGYNPNVIAAEDDELGVRLRQSGGKLMRLPQESMIHDANMTKASQWWTRAKRCGYAFASVAALHGAPPERKFIRERQRTILWGGLIPLASMLAAVPTHGLSLLLLLRYPLTMLRTMQATHKRGFSWYDSIAWGISCGLSPLPGFLGVVKFYMSRDRQQQIIEYKH